MVIVEKPVFILNNCKNSDGPIYIEKNSNVLVQFNKLTKNDELFLSFPLVGEKIESVARVVVGMFQYMGYTRNFLNYRYVRLVFEPDYYGTIKKIKFSLNGVSIVATCDTSIETIISEYYKEAKQC